MADRPLELGYMSLGDHVADPVTGERQSQRRRFATLVEAAARAEVVGFSSVWLGEHHFSEWIVSSPQVALAAIAERTTTVRLGTSVTLLVNLDPVRVAEDFATLDLVSDGRAELAIGRGILSQTYAAFGQDLDRSRPDFEEKLDLLLRLWREGSVDWAGTVRPPLEGVEVQPRPLQRPHPPVWVGGGTSEASVDLAARLGLPLMLPSVFAKPERFAPMAERYRERYTAAGHDPAGMRVGGCNHCHVARTTQEARQRWRPYYRAYYDLGQRALAQSAGLWSGRTIAPFDFDGATRGAGICGSPAEVTDRILAIRDLLGLDVHLLMFDLGGLPERDLFATLDLFGAEVVPAVRGAVPAAPATA
jgi:alkanesulfonate monooxygenase SsuD/methylene tetrahydromethanopterin reductase-like flavin-dependent oxidoreductase (luciferase family)